MSNATRRVLELFLQLPKRGVTDVTGVTNPIVTPVTPVTYQKQRSPVESARGVTAASRTGAEALAFEARIIEWLNRNPAPSPAGQCAWCGKRETESAVVVPFGAEPGTHAWLHSECWRPWHEARRAEAAKALRQIGGFSRVAGRQLT
jgi:hypothetical protein